MISSLSPALILAAAVGCGLVGGVFFAFSTFVMKALGRLPTAHGIAAMQSINVVVLNPLFLGAFLGTAAFCAGALVAAWSHPSFTVVTTAAALYIFGTFLVTMFGNVPLNERLARVDPRSAQAAEIWRDYLRRWTRWNHVRTAAALLACALLILASRAQAPVN